MERISLTRRFFPFEKQTIFIIQIQIYEFFFLFLYVFRGWINSIQFLRILYPVCRCWTRKKYIRERDFSISKMNRTNETLSVEQILESFPFYFILFFFCLLRFRCRENWIRMVLGSKLLWVERGWGRMNGINITIHSFEP